MPGTATIAWINIGGSDPLLLDTYTGAAAAYSLRKLRTDYAGSAIRIRRSNDNSEQDIGFSGNDLDTSAITSFVGSNSAYVTTWYDQSGNSRDATQATSANQPRIVNAGTIDTRNSKPGVFFTDSWLDISIGSNTQDYSVFTSSYVTNTSGVNTIVGSVLGGLQTRFIGSGSDYTSSIVRTYQAQILTTGSLSGNAVKLAGFFTTSSASAIYINGVSQATGSGPSFTQEFSVIGANNGAGGGNYEERFTDVIHEIIIYKSDQSSNRSGIESNINTYYSIY